MSDKCHRCGSTLATGRIGACPVCLLESELPPLVLGGAVELGEEVGHGGMGTVYKARHLRLGHTVAVKLLPEELVAQPESRARFEREAKALARLRHPHIVTVHDFGQEGDQPYIVMEYVEGGALSKRIPLPVPQAIEIALQVCDALAYAHKQGVVHRDIKPDNILLDGAQGEHPRVKVGDFGIARIVGGDTTQARVTAAGVAVGTPHYIAPEALSGAPADPRMDIYSLGVVLYQAVTGKLPMGDFQAPRAIEGPLRRALASDPARRYASVEEFRADLEAALHGSGEEDLPPDERTWLRAVAMLQSISTAVAIWAFLLCVSPKVIAKDEVLPLIMVAPTRLADGRVSTLARFEMWPSVAALATFALAIIPYGLLRRHWRRTGFDRYLPDRRIPEARLVLLCGLVALAVYALRKWMEALGWKSAVQYVPVVGAAIEVMALYLFWVTILSAWRGRRPLRREPLLWVGFAFALVPPTVDFVLYVISWRP